MRGDFEWAGAGWRLGEARPASPHLLPLPRACDQETGEQIVKEAERALGVERDLAFVDLLPMVHHRHRRTHDGSRGRVVLRRLVVPHPLQIPDDVVHGERRAVVECDPCAQGEDPPRRIAGIDGPGLKQPRRRVGRLIYMGVIPVDDAVIGGIAEEAETLAAIVRNARDRGRSDAVIAIRSTCAGAARAYGAVALAAAAAVRPPSSVRRSSLVAALVIVLFGCMVG